MAQMKIAGMGKWGVVLAYTVIFIQIIFGLAAAGAQSVQEHSIWPFVDYTGQTLFGADDGLYKNVRLLSEDSQALQLAAEQAASVSEKLTVDEAREKFENAIRDDIVKQVFILVIMFYLAFKFWSMMFSSQQHKGLLMTEAAVAALITLAVAEYAFVAFNGGGLIWPFRGVFELIVNAGSIWTIPSMTPVVVEAAGNVTIV